MSAGFPRLAGAISAVLVSAVVAVPSTGWLPDAAPTTGVPRGAPAGQDTTGRSTSFRSASATRAADTSSAQDAASKKAVAGKRAVVVDSMTTGTEQTTALPDGTFQLVEHAAPVRVHQGGGWVAEDTTLRRSTAGLSTTATTVPLTLSAGGNTPLATLAVGRGTLAVSWPTTLPAPRVSGAAATYPDVLPGVDLRIAAADSGYTEQLVVRSRRAAANPALSAIVLGVRTTGGVHVVGSPQGGLTVLDAGGNAVLSSDPALMWDATVTDPSVGSPAHEARVSTKVSAESVTLSPDTALFTAPGTTYPVTIDPDFHPTRTVWTKTFSGFPTRNYLNGGVDGAEAKVGACYVPSGECNGLGVARTYYQFAISSLRDNGGLVKHVEFNVAETFGSSCSARNIELESTGGISTSTTWNTQPSGPVVGTIAMGCTPTSFAYNISAMWPNKPVTQATVTLMLRASDEADQLSWRKFTNNPSLVFTYNRKPGTPTGLTTAGKACATSAGAQVLNPVLQANGAQTVGLGAKSTDPDGQNVKITFTWFDGATQLGTATSPFVASGTAFVLQVPASAFTDGQVIDWHAQASDGTDVGPLSGNCFFTVDETPPAVGPSVTSSDYPGSAAADCPGVVRAGGIGQTGTFAFGPNGTGTTTTTTSDIAGYIYGVDTPPAVRVNTATPGGAASVQITPRHAGPNLLNVQSVDKAGNVSPKVTYCFSVLPGGKDAVHHYPLDGTINQAAAPDSPGDGVAPLNGTMTGYGNGGTWTTGQIGAAALFNGTLNDYIQVPGKPVDTSKTFAVSAWVRVDKLGNFPTAVSMDGVHAPGFQLQAQPDGHWAFVMMGTDTNGGGLNYRLVSKSSVVVGQWTQVIGSYDDGAQLMSIYVNGVLEGTLAHDSSWAAPGPLSIGRSMFDGANSDPFTGAVDDVRLFDHAIVATGDISDDTLTNAQNLATQPLQQKAWYDFEESSGSVATDVTGGWNPATLSGGASREDPADDRFGGGALALDGSTGFAATSGPVVATATSFTASAWVNLDDLPDTPMTILAVEGAQTSDFALQYRDDGGTPSFAAEVAGSDVAAPTENLVTGGIPSAGVWTQVGMAYNAVTRNFALFVDGQQVGQSATVVATPWTATGPVEIGRGRVAGAGAQYFAGRIDNVQLFTGAQSRTQAADALFAVQKAPTSPYDGELTRWASKSTPAHVSTASGAAPQGFGLEGPLGALAPVGAADTSELYSCMANGADEFSSVDPACEGKTLLGRVGPIFNQAADTPGAVALFRCSWIVGSLTYHFDSTGSTCEGKTVEFRLGYLRPLATLARYRNPDTGQFWASANNVGLLPDYDVDSAFGTAVVSTAALAGTAALRNCQNGTGDYLSTSPTCNGDTVLGGSGFIWTSQPTGAASTQLYACVLPESGQRFESLDSGCEGLTSTAPTVLGWVLTQL